MFSNTTLNRIYDRGSSVYNYSLGGDDFTTLSFLIKEYQNERTY